MITGPFSLDPALFQMIQSWRNRWRRVAPGEDQEGTSASFLKKFTRTAADQEADGNEAGEENPTFCFGLIAGYFIVDTSKSFHYWVRGAELMC